jgi:hypothetical protein
VMRFLPRFSIRTLAIFMTLVCAYFGSWEATKQGGKGVTYSHDLVSPMPFILYDEVYLIPPAPPQKVHRQYFFWFFSRPIATQFHSTHDISDR